MDVSPPKKVSYRLSPSPVRNVSYAHPDLRDTDPSHTPSRKRRAVVGSEQPQLYKTRRKHQETRHQSQNATVAASTGQGASVEQDTSDSGWEVPSSSWAAELGRREVERVEPPVVSDPDQELDYKDFVASVLAEDCSVYQVSQRLFVVNGWKQGAVTGKWYHLERSVIENETSIVCLCTRGRTDLLCWHSRFLSEYGAERFPFDERLSGDDSATYIFSRVESGRDETYTNIFSVPSRTNHPSIKNRAVVEHCGDDHGGGIWKCSKDTQATNCSHLSDAQRCLQRCIQGELEGSPIETTESGESNDVEAFAVKFAARVSESISYLPLPPPIWARIAADGDVRPPVLLQQRPEKLRLDSRSTCSCTEPRAVFDPTRPVEERRCQIYGLTEAFQSIVEVQKCLLCQHGYIGPECTKMGVFNLNNRSLFTLALLDDYTCQFTRSETPFVSWVATTSCRYQNHQSLVSFIKEKVFRNAWFSYIRLVRLENDMCCSTCGPTPEVTIWDGVTLAFNRRNLLPTIKPPTTCDDKSEVKALIRPQRGLQLISDPTIRKDISFVLTGPSLELPPVPGAARNQTALESEEGASCAAAPSGAVLAMLERVERIPGIVERLSRVDSDASLGTAFRQWFGIDTLIRGGRTSSVYKELFLQLAAEENALQFLNGKAMKLLESFLRSPGKDMLANLIHVPALYQVAAREMTGIEGLTATSLAVFRWVYVRSHVVLHMLKQHGFPLTPPLGSGTVDSWRETGCCYGMPQIRSRPKYPNLPKDNLADLGNTDLRGEGCQKFYSTYGESRLTGGIMCVWCQHSVCYGFHCIPSAEGRNDVFSAIFSRWSRAPGVVVYDFACALQPYCLTREPEFFADTLFVIDAFHAKGHTKCGHAAFLTNYGATNNKLMMVNSSAGECGNGGISRIRKSVSYMSQERAILYTKVFLSIWNRQRIQKLERKE